MDEDILNESVHDTSKIEKIKVLAPFNRIDDSVDLGVFDGFELNLKPKYKFNRRFLEKFAEDPLSFTVDDFKLPVYSIHPPYSEKDMECFNLAEHNLPQTKALKKILKFGNNVDAKILVAHAGHVYRIENMEKGEKNLILNLRELADYADKMDMKIGIENESHNRNDFYRLGQDYKSVRNAIEELDHPVIGATMDVAHALCMWGYDGAERMIDKLGPYTVLAHVSYNHGNFDEHLPLTKIENAEIPLFQKLLKKLVKYTPAINLEINEDFVKSVQVLNDLIY